MKSSEKNAYISALSTYPQNLLLRDIFFILKIFFYSNIGSVDKWISRQESKRTSRQLNNVTFSYPRGLLIRRNR